jgi:hypothetical protein
MLLDHFSIVERSFVPATKHGGHRPFHRSLAAVKLALLRDEVLLPAPALIRGELLSLHQGIFHPRGQKTSRLRYKVLLLDP